MLFLIIYCNLLIEVFYELKAFVCQLFERSRSTVPESRSTVPECRSTVGKSLSLAIQEQEETKRRISGMIHRKFGERKCAGYGGEDGSNQCGEQALRAGKFRSMKIWA